MDYMGILKEAWDVTRRNKRLWILGLFAAGSASLSSNWNSSSSNSGSSNSLPAGWENIHTPSEALQRGLDLAGKQLGVSLGTANQWWMIIGIAVLMLLVMCLVLWAIGIAARGGLIEQTREAIAERPTSAAAGWRRGLRLWGRVFSVGFLLALPFVGLGVLGLLTFAVFGLPALIASGGNPELIFSGGAPAAAAGLVTMGLVLGLIGLVGLVFGVFVSILEEVALRYAVLDGRGAISSIRATWTDLWAKRGIASMWLVMVLVNIAAGIAGAILFIPIVVLIGLAIAGAVVAGGTAMFWLIGPALLVLLALGMLIRAVYVTFLNTAWTSFYDRMQRPDLDAPQADLTEPVAV
jgi:hypothetical protein